MSRFPARGKIALHILERELSDVETTRRNGGGLTWHSGIKVTDGCRDCPYVNEDRLSTDAICTDGLGERNDTGNDNFLPGSRAFSPSLSSLRGRAKSLLSRLPLRWKLSSLRQSRLEKHITSLYGANVTLVKRRSRHRLTFPSLRVIPRRIPQTIHWRV